LFSGIGAPELAAPEIDWRWCAEIDPFASAILAERFPTVPNLGDVNEVEWDAVEPVDLVAFGSPCQSFSIAGKRAGLGDPHGNLAIIGLSIIERIRPRWMVFENVPGLLSSDGGRDFGDFLGLLGQCGYGFAYRVLDAQYFGVPQRRRRVFVVGHLGDWRAAAAVLFEPESLRGDPPPRREAGKAIARPIASCAPGGSGYRADSDTAENIIPILEVGARTGVSTDDVRAGIGIGESGDPMFTLQSGKHHGIVGPLAANGGTERKHGYGMGQQDWENGYAIAYGGNRQSGSIDVATAVNAHGGPHGRQDFETETFVAHSLRADGFDASEDGTGRGTPLVPIDMRQSSRGGKITNNRANGSGGPPGHGVGEDGDPAFTVSERGQAVAFTSKDHGQDAGGCAPTLRGMMGEHANAGGQVAVAFQPRIGRNGRGQPTEIVPALNGTDAGETSDMRPCIAFMERPRPGGPSLEVSGEIACAIRANAGRQNGDDLKLLNGMAVRRLTPIECERLQGFPDDFTLITYRGKPAADGPRYRALGNAMAVPVIGWILGRVRDSCM
jgi:DNA (cytosine-5)-methyltransferase 1